MGTVKQLIEDAMRDIVALAEGEQASADQINDGKRKLVSMLELWSIDGLMVPYLATETFTLPTNQNFVTWKPGGNFNSSTPIDVVAVSWVFGNLQKKLQRMDWTAYLNLQTVGIVSAPTFFLWDPQATNSTLNFDVTPYGGTLRTVSKKPLDTAFELTDDLEFPIGYDQTLRTNLAIALCPSYQRTASGELVALATSSKRIVERYNVKPPSMRVSLPGGRRYGSMLPLRSS